MTDSSRAADPARRLRSQASTERRTVKGPIAAVLGGGTRFHVAVRDGSRELLRATTATAAPEVTVAALRDLLAPFALRAVGLACFGPIDLDDQSSTYGTLQQTPKPGWSEFPLATALSRGLGGVAFAVDSDVNAAARPEAVTRSDTSLAYITVGTGVGVGLYANGSSVRFPRHPEAGHFRGAHGDPFAGVCPFHGACIEGLVAGPALQARTRTHPQDLRDDHPVWDWVAAHLAILAHTVALLRPVDRLVIGGGIGEGRRFLHRRVHDRCRALLQDYVPLPPSWVDAPSLQRPDLEGAFLLAESVVAGGGRSW